MCQPSPSGPAPRTRRSPPRLQTASSPSSSIRTSARAPLTMPPRSRAAAGVESRQLAIGKEAGEARLGVAHPSLAALERRLSAAEAEQLAGRAERIEVSRLELRRHGSYSARWYCSATP